MNTTKINLVCRDRYGAQIAVQTFDPSEADRAERIMIARNRAEVAQPDGHRWGIEAEVPATEVSA